MRKEMIPIWNNQFPDKESAPQKMRWNISSLSSEEKDLLKEYLKSKFNLTFQGEFARRRGLIVNVFTETFVFSANHTTSGSANPYSSKAIRTMEDVTGYLNDQLSDWL